VEERRIRRGTGEGGREHVGGAYWGARKKTSTGWKNTRKDKFRWGVGPVCLKGEPIWAENYKLKKWTDELGGGGFGACLLWLCGGVWWRCGPRDTTIQKRSSNVALRKRGLGKQGGGGATVQRFLWVPRVGENNGNRIKEKHRLLNGRAGHGPQKP